MVEFKEFLKIMGRGAWRVFLFVSGISFFLGLGILIAQSPYTLGAFIVFVCLLLFYFVGNEDL